MDFEEQETQFQPTKKPNQEMESNNNGGGLFFKLQAPKPESLDQDYHQNPPAPQFTRTCEICQKGFSSGKALGGHMRMHAQANRELFKSSKNSKTLQRKPAKILKPNSNNSDVISSNGGIEGNNNSSNSNKSTMMMRPVCVECGKNFPSLKSLCGHMRSHPEREYRGIQPPQTTRIAAKNSSSSTLSDVVPDDDQNNDGYNKAHEDQIESAETTCVVGSKSCVVDLSKTLPGWSLTATRGRKSIGSSSANSESVSGLDLSHAVEEEQMEEAVHDLLMLAQASTCFNGGLKDNQGKGADQMCEASNSNFFIDNNKEEADYMKDKTQVTDYVSSSKKRIEMCSQSRKIEEKWCDKYGGMGVLGIGFGSEKSSVKNFLKLGSMEDNKNMEEELSDSQNSDSFVLGSARRRRKSKKMKFLDLGGVVGGIIGARSPSYQRQHKLRCKCSLCGKSFPTHQALGGHMSSHNKLKNNNNIIIHHSSMVDQSASADVSSSEVGHNVDQTETAIALDQPQQAQHKCKICNKTFPTGQALGGHQRCHWTGPTDQPPPQGSQVASPGEASQNTGRKVLDFDLNELPSMEFEEGTDQYGVAGYATSSYNSAT